MPSRNALKIYLEDTFYHIYNRGVNKDLIFRDASDYVYFLHLFKRHLSIKPTRDKQQREYRHLANNIELIAFCLMPNHFHLLVYNRDDDGIQMLMRTIATSYSIYFNRKYQRSGTLFQGVYRAVEIDADAYLQHITRYIHRNPSGYKIYEFSSYKNYTGSRNQEWIKPARILQMFNNQQEYIKFVEDYDMLSKEEKIDLESDLANH